MTEQTGILTSLKDNEAHGQLGQKTNKTLLLGKMVSLAQTKIFS